MTREEFIEYISASQAAQLEIIKRKNADYGGSSVWGNFELAQQLGISVKDALLVRMADKLKRIANLTRAEAMVKDEAIEDTLDDLANYTNILKTRIMYEKIIHQDNPA